MEKDWKRPTDQQRGAVDELLKRMAAACAPAIELTWEWRDEERDLRVRATRHEGGTTLSHNSGAYQGEIAQAADPVAFVEDIAKKVLAEARG